MPKRPQTYTSALEVEQHINTNFDTVKVVADAITDGTIAEVVVAKAATAADVVSTNADVVSTNADVVSTGEDVVSTGEDVIATAADVVSTGDDVVSTSENVNNSAEWANKAEDSLISAAAGGDEADDYSALHHAKKALASEIAAEASWDSLDARYLGAKTLDPALDNDGDPLLVGALYFNSTSNNLRVWDSSVWGVISTSTNNSDATVDPTITDDNTANYGVGSWWVNGSTKEYFICLDASIGAAVWEQISNNSENANLPARNTVLTKDAMSQDDVSTPGFSVVLSTADDGITGTNFLRWTKDRNNATGWIQSDSVRGDFYLASSSAAAEVATVPVVNADDVSFQWDLPNVVTGVTNHNKPYTSHYNARLGISVTGYEGDGVAGHEIPHHLGVESEICFTKNRSSAYSWNVLGNFFGNSVAGDFLAFNSTGALSTVTTLGTMFDGLSVQLSTNVGFNESASDHIMYNIASVPGVTKVDSYIGTGADGNYVPCGFKAAFVMIRNLAVGNWLIADVMRGDDLALFANLTNAEATTYDVYADDNGFRVDGAGTNGNVLNNQYIFVAFAESSIDAEKAITNYELPTNADQLAIANPTLMTFANGFNANGQVDLQEEVAGATLTYGAGHEDKTYYIYRDNGTTWGQSEVRPLEGKTRDTADYSGVVSPSDSSLRTTAHHFDYESETGIVLASGEDSAPYLAYHAFNKDNNDLVSDAASVVWLVATTTSSWVQYKFKEKRILKSWRMREGQIATRIPKLFTIEGSNDGLNWTAIDSTYTASNYVGNGAYLWGDLQSTSGNTTAYLYHRINTTANNGDATYTSIAELEFNTKIASDYYLVDEAKMFNDAGTRLDRVYIGEALLNASGDVMSFINYAPGKQQLNEIEVHGKAVFHGEVLGEMFATAWVTFDGTVNPPLVKDSFNVKDIVDVGTGSYEVIFDEPMKHSNYIIAGTAFSGTDYLIGLSLQTKNYANLKIYTTATILSNAIVRVVFFGGKEIK